MGKTNKLSQWRSFMLANRNMPSFYCWKEGIMSGSLLVMEVMNRKVYRWDDIWKLRLKAQNKSIVWWKSTRLIKKRLKGLLELMILKRRLGKYIFRKIHSLYFGSNYIFPFLDFLTYIQPLKMCIYPVPRTMD